MARFVFGRVRTNVHRGYFLGKYVTEVIGKVLCAASIPVHDTSVSSERPQYQCPTLSQVWYPHGKHPVYRYTLPSKPLKIVSLWALIKRTFRLLHQHKNIIIFPVRGLPDKQSHGVALLSPYISQSRDGVGSSTIVTEEATQPRHSHPMLYCMLLFSSPFDCVPMHAAVVHSGACTCNFLRRFFSLTMVDHNG